MKNIFREKMAGSRPSVKVEGIDIMNDDPSKTRVVFGKVDGSLVQKIANEALTHFCGSGFVKDNDFRSGIKLHLTLINSKHAEKALAPNESQRRGYRYNKPRLEFDARSILTVRT